MDSFENYYCLILGSGCVGVGFIGDGLQESFRCFAEFCFDIDFVGDVSEVTWKVDNFHRKCGTLRRPTVARNMHTDDVSVIYLPDINY